ncbi:MAG: hypothetical protein ACREMP_08905 [Candidatus Tyrphobacter sp.]
MSARAGSTLSVEHPFPGLRPFEASDREFFFGRRTHVLDMYGLLDLSRFIAVIGSSGSGKSSLVRAGLLPLLEDEKTWHTVTLHPGDHPMAELTHALADLSDRTEQSDDETSRSIRRRRIELALRKSSFGISAALAEMPSLHDSSVLIVADQFEELFRYTADAGSRDEASFFVQSLLEATRNAERNVCVLITMRSDFIGDCARFNGLPEAVSAAQFLVPSLTRDQREEVIRQPIEKAGATIEPQLVERLLNDIGPELDQLPVLSHCLSRLWSRAKDRHLTLADYEAVGGVSGALSKHANEVLASASLAGLQGGVEQVFRALSDRDKEGRATRRALLFERLLAETGCSRADLVKILDRFRAEDCSFVTPSTAAIATLRDDTRIDVVHEALLRRWNRISAEDTGWLAQEEADGRFYRGLLAMLEGVAATATVTLPLDQVEERWARWIARPRTAAWAQRYGGHFERVQRMLEDSRAALAAARESERKRIEDEERARRERLALETRLAQEQARAARLLAQRTRALAAVMSVIAVLAIGAAIAAAIFGARSRAAESQARAQTARATRALAFANAERKAVKAALKREVVAETTALRDATELRGALALATEKTRVARVAQTQASASAASEANVEHSLALVSIDHSMYQTGYDNRVAGLIGTDAYAIDRAGNARDVLLTAAWTPNAIGRVALPPWTLGAVTGDGRTIVVLAGHRQSRYGERVSGDLLTIDATTLAVLGRTPGVSASMMCGFPDDSRVALANGDAIALYGVSDGSARADGTLQVRGVRALGCLRQGRVVYVDRGGALVVAGTGGARTIGRIAGVADGIVLSSSRRYAAVTTTSGIADVYDLTTGRRLWEHKLFTSADDCSAIVGCSGAVAFDPNERHLGLAWYDAGNIYTQAVGADTDASAQCEANICNGVSLLYFTPAASNPFVVSTGGVVAYNANKRTYTLQYNDGAGSQRRPVLDTQFNMYVTPYDPTAAQQPNPFHSGLAAESFTRVDGPLLGTIPASQWDGSYGLSGHRLVIAGASGYLGFDLDRLRSEFWRSYKMSYHVRMFDCGDGEHAVAFNMMTGDMDVLDIRTNTPRVLYHFRLPGVKVRNGYYENFVELGYDPQTQIFTELAFSQSFAMLHRFTISGKVLLSETRSQLLRGAHLTPSQVLNYTLSARGTYIAIKVKAPAPDALVRYDGMLVGTSFSIDYISPSEQLVIATKHTQSGYHELTYSLPEWRQNAYLIVPATSQQIVFSPDGNTMAYDDQEGANNASYVLHLYDLTAHQTYRDALPNPPDLASYSDLSFSADDRYLIATYKSTEGNFHRIAIYNVDPHAWARSACLMAGAPLSAREFGQYVGPGIPYDNGCRRFSGQMYRP